MTWLRGRHALKAGGEARYSRNNELDLDSISGLLKFDAQPTGNPLASLLVGLPLSFSEYATPTLDRRSWYFSGFLKDDWSATRSLTINLGLRWEMDTPMVDANLRMNGFDAAAINPVSGTPGVVRFAGVNGYPERPYQLDWNNFGPRLGFAWKVPGASKVVVRGGMESSSLIPWTAFKRSRLPSAFLFRPCSAALMAAQRPSCCAMACRQSHPHPALMPLEPCRLDKTLRRRLVILNLIGYPVTLTNSISRYSTNCPDQ